MSFISLEYKELKVGTQCVIWYSGYGRTDPGRYSRPLAVTRVTKTLFELEPESDGVKPKRFNLDGGSEYGRKYGRGCRARVATPEFLKEVDEFNSEIAEQERVKASEERQAEIKLREKYGAITINDEDLQSKYLAPLRAACEAGERLAGEFLRNFEGVTIENDNYYRIADAVRRESEHGDFQTGVTLRNCAMDLQCELVTLITEFSKGARYTVDGVEVNDIDDLCRAKVTEKLRRLYDNFFCTRFSSRTITEGDQRFITVLRSILGMEYEYAPVRQIKEEEEGNA